MLLIILIAAAVVGSLMDAVGRSILTGLVLCFILKLYEHRLCLFRMRHQVVQIQHGVNWSGDPSDYYECKRCGKIVSDFDSTWNSGFITYEILPR